MIRLKKYTIDNAKLEITGVSARVINEGHIGTETLANLCADVCTVTRADCLAVIKAFSEEIKKILVQGFSLEMQRLGSFRVTIEGPSASNMNLWNISNNVRKTNVRFTPSTYLRDRIQLGAEGVRVRIID